MTGEDDVPNQFTLLYHVRIISLQTNPEGPKSEKKLNVSTCHHVISTNKMHIC